MEKDRRLTTLQKLLGIPCGDLPTALTHSADALAEALGADKVDAFLYDEQKDSLVAVGASMQPLSGLQKRLGLDVLPLSNGGRVVNVYKTGVTFVTGNSQQDPDELRGIKEGLKIQSQIGVPLDVGGKRRGMLMIASLQENFFVDDDVRFTQVAVEWVSMVVHRAQLLIEAERTAVAQGRKIVAEELITTVAHDLRHYLSPISLRLYALRERAELDGKKEYIDDANAALKSTLGLSNLITSILDVAKLDRGIFDLNPEPIDLVDLVTDVAKVLETPKHKIVVKTSTSAVVVGDRDRLRQCLDNIIANAIRYSPDDASVSVFINREVRDELQFATVEVVDEGPGVPEPMRERLFERFAHDKNGSGGLGLGLYLAKRIAVAHGGDVRADNQAGHGARFTMHMPLRSATSEESETQT